MTDAELLCRARTGDADAWRTLYRRYLPAAWRQAAALTRDVHVAEDVTSEAMLALLRNLQPVERNVGSPVEGGGIDGSIEGNIECLSAWLRNVVKCRVADHFRKQSTKHEQNGQKGPRGQTECSNGTADVADGHAPAAEALEADERREQVQRALDQLPERDRLMLQWKYFDGLAVKEIAARVGDGERAVEAILYRARKEFRRVFESLDAPADVLPLRRRDSDVPRISAPGSARGWRDT
jgi:RNA polymerase sigma-70 factor (ECF subfamily)